jgi:hypothetical protein
MNNDDLIKPSVNTGPFAQTMFAKLISRVFLVVIFLIPLAACTNYAGYNTLPIIAPFELHKPNNQLELKFRVNKEQHYSFNLIFKYKKNDSRERKRVSDLMGDFNAGNDEKLSKGEPIAVSLKIISLDDELSGGDEYLMTEIGTQYLTLLLLNNGSFNKEIYRLQLLPGRYKVIVTTLKEMPAFKSTKVDFRVSRAHVGK